MICCKNELGEYPHNEDIETGIIASQDGVHKLTFTGANGVKFSFNLTLETDDEIVIPKGILNEDFYYILNVKQPDGELLTDSDCENFTFKTYIDANICGAECSY